MEIVLPQAASPPQCDSPPRRLPAVSTRLNGPGAPHAESQSLERKGIFPLKASLDVCTSPKQGTFFYSKQTDVGVDDDEKTIAQATVCEKFAKPPKRIGSSEEWYHGVPSKLSSLTLEGNGKAVIFPSRRMPVSCAVCPCAFPMFFLVFLCFLLFVCKIFSSRYERRGDFSI